MSTPAGIVGPDGDGPAGLGRDDTTTADASNSTQPDMRGQTLADEKRMFGRGSQGTASDYAGTTTAYRD